MKLTFLGTRGNIDARSERHQRHSALLVSYGGKTVMVDAGKDWEDQLDEISPDAIVVTHAHPDHVDGMRDGAPCPVFAPAIAWITMKRFGIQERREVKPRIPFEIDGITFEAFPVEHSAVAPAVGYRIQTDDTVVFYVPDVVSIRDRAEALAGIRAYIGDAATVTRSLVRERNGKLIGHAPVRSQLSWCEEEGVDRALFTHCGSPIVGDDEESAVATVHRLGEERGISASIAHDGMELNFQ